MFILWRCLAVYITGYVVAMTDEGLVATGHRAPATQTLTHVIHKVAAVTLTTAVIPRIMSMSADAETDPTGEKLYTIHVPRISSIIRHFLLFHTTHRPCVSFYLGGKTTS